MGVVAIVSGTRWTTGLFALSRRNLLTAVEITVDYYNGAYGPTIRIAVSCLQHLTHLRDVFADLAQGKRRTADLGMLGVVELSYKE